MEDHSCEARGNYLPAVAKSKNQEKLINKIERAIKANTANTKNSISPS